MSQPERFEILILGSGKSGKLLAWHMAQSGRRTAVIERQWIGGSCPNIACLPSKNEIWSARVAHLARLGAQFGVATGRIHSTPLKASMRGRRRFIKPPLPYGRVGAPSCRSRGNA
jgi:pyruvate/2-oxoglutarate dehydrogenase complex dihydrolipoamide dehydrogenase (E3) component